MEQSSLVKQPVLVMYRSRRIWKIRGPRRQPVRLLLTSEVVQSALTSVVPEASVMIVQMNHCPKDGDCLGLRIDAPLSRIERRAFRDALTKLV